MTLVSEAMNREVLAVPPEASAAEAAALAREARSEHLLVIDGGTLVGILCSCDLDEAAPGDPVCECMSLPVLTIRPDATVEDAALTMLEFGVGCLPVACGGLLLGTLSGDELAAFGVVRGPGHRCRHRGRGKMPHA
jgi:acetoin utilization protein AcuB